MKPRAYERSDLLLLAALTLAWAVWAWRFWFVLDDAYISLRYSRNWGAGLGLRYNLGPQAPVEGYSNFLLVAWGALVHRLGLDLLTWVPLLTCAAMGALQVAVYDVARRLGSERFIAAIAAASVGLSAMGGVWSSSGLETALYALGLFLTFERLVLGEQIDARGGAVIGLLTAMSRFEGILWMPVIGLLALGSRVARGQSARPLLRWALLLGAPYLVYTLWRHAHFGMWLPSTTHAKVGFSEAVLLRGLEYVGLQALTTLSLWVIVPGSLLAVRSPRAAVAVPVALMAWAFPAYAALVGGDFMTFGRFLVPMLPFAALLLAWLLDAVALRGSPLRAAALGVAVVVLANLPGWNVHLVPTSVRSALHVRDNRDSEHFRSEAEQWQRQVGSAAQWSVRGKAYKLISQPGDSIVLSAIGAAGYYSGLTVYDRHGFVNTEVSTRPRPAPTADVLRSPGHDDPVDDTFFLELGYEPTFLFGRMRTAHDAASAVKQSAEQRKRLRKRGLDQQYAAEVWPVIGEGLPEAPTQTLLLVWRRIPEGQSPEQAWARFDRMLRGLESGRPVEVIDLDRGRVVARRR
jgi:arabinofuranosyltransferase